MSERTEPTPGPPTPISVVLLAQALATETEASLHDWRKYLDALRRPFEIVLLQETRPEITAPPSIGVHSPGVRVIPYDRSTGVGAALNEVIRTTKYALLAFCPCDRQYQPSDLERMLKLLEFEDEQKRRPDLVVGYRVGMPIPFWRVLFDTVIGLLSRIVIGLPLMPTECWLGQEGRARRWLARWGFGLRVNDPECPFRIVRREILQRIPIQSRGDFAMIEMLAKANHLSGLIAEQAVTWTAPAAPLALGAFFAEDAWLVFRSPEFGPRSPLAA